MYKYIAFLRGINISGKNKISMAELKTIFGDNGFGDTKTYLNSGNVLFFSDIEDAEALSKKIETMIHDSFGIDIPVFTIKQKELEDIIGHSPSWWGNGNKEIYDNLILIIPPANYQDIFCEIGEPKKELERIENYKQAIFWSFSRNDYQKTNWWSKTASTKISDKITIRTANTIRKMVDM